MVSPPQESIRASSNLNSLSSPERLTSASSGFRKVKSCNIRTFLSILAQCDFVLDDQGRCWRLSRSVLITSPPGIFSISDEVRAWHAPDVPARQIPHRNSGAMRKPVQRLLVRQAHDKRQSDIQSRYVLVVQMADLPPNSLTPNGDRLVGHHLRSHSQSVLLGRIDRYPKIRRIVGLGSHLADNHKRMFGRERVRLHNHRRSWLTIVAGCRDCHHVAALHWPSNSETASAHRIASDSPERSRPATCLATRLRTAFERASGTTKRNSRKPRARRRSRIAFIRSAVSAMDLLPPVTRYSVTRYGKGINRHANCHAQRNPGHLRRRSCASIRQRPAAASH